MPLLAGLDLGTTSIKAILYDSESGKVLTSADRPTPVYSPQPGWSEHDPEALWGTVCAVLREAVNGRPVRGLAIGSMAEAGIALDRAGLPLDPIIAWFDRRSEPQARWIEEQISVPDLYRLTGQRVSPSFGITKLLWLRQNRPQVFSHLHTWLPLSSYILFRLTGERFVDFSIASRSLLFDQNTTDWSPHLLDFAGLAREQLPVLQAGSAAAGKLTASAASVTGLPSGTLCATGGHDHLCAAFAAGAFRPGAVVDSTGTAQAVVQVLPAFLPNSRLAEHGYACYSHVLPDQVILKAGLKAAGSAISWLAQRLSGENSSPDFSALELSAREGIAKRAGPIWLPHLLESGTPESDRLSRAALVGARIDHDNGDLFRAMLESLAFWLRYNLETIQTYTGATAEEVILIGGTTRLRLLSELKADLLNQPVQIPMMSQGTAVGAALLAGLACGLFHSPQEAVSSLNDGVESIQPDPLRVKWYDRLYREAYRPLYAQLKEINERLGAIGS